MQISIMGLGDEKRQKTQEKAGDEDDVLEHTA